MKYSDQMESPETQKSVIELLAKILKISMLSVHKGVNRKMHMN